MSSSCYMIHETGTDKAVLCTLTKGENIAMSDGRAVVGELLHYPIVALVCCCCGNCTKGRQWHNRDEGYGLCDSCAAHDPDATSMAGVKGWHRGVGAGK